MHPWLMYTAYFAFGIAAALASIALFFFTLTRGALLMRSTFGWMQQEAAHVYPIYSNMRLIRLVDYQPVIAGILLFQYSRLVSIITHGLKHSSLKGQQVLITSCAFGNVMPRVVKAALQAGAGRVLVTDIIPNELKHAKSKLLDYVDQIDYQKDNAVAMQQASNSVAANIIFFLLHELPHHLKGEALKEAVRVLAPGGKLYLAEFHRPRPWLLRCLSWTYFKVFEPYGLALWNTHDPVRMLQDMPGIECQRQVVFFGNFQVIIATKVAQ